MQGFVNKGVRGYRMVGLFLRQGRIFIGLSITMRPQARPEKQHLKAKGLWFSRGEHWIKTGIVWRAEAWFFGIAATNPGKSLQPVAEPACDIGSSTQADLRPLTSNGSLAHG